MEHTGNILVVDSSFNQTDKIAQTLIQEGYRAFRASNCGQAVIIMEHCRIDLAVIGDLLPEEDGSCILEIMTGESIPVLVLSRYSSSHDKSISDYGYREKTLNGPPPDDDFPGRVRAIMSTESTGIRIPA